MTYITEQHKTKTCKACGRALPLHCFSTSTRTDDGVSLRCRQCINESKAATQPRKDQPMQPIIDTTKTLNETLNTQAENLINTYIRECERQIESFDRVIAKVKEQRHIVAVNLANARRKIKG